jgi:hypothetical protein
MLPGDRAGGIAEADTCDVAQIGDVEVGWRVGRSGTDVDRRTEVVGDVALVAMPLRGPEVVVDHLANGDAFTVGRRGDQHLFGLIHLGVVAPAHETEHHEHGRGEDGQCNHQVASLRHRVEHDRTVARRGASVSESREM